MSQLNIYGEILDKKVKIYNRELIDKWSESLKEGEKIVIKFNVSSEYKSERQLRLIYHEFRQISNHTGYTIDEVKLMLKIKAGLFFSAKIEEKDITVCKSISDMTIKQLSEFIEFTDRWSTQTLSLPLLTADDINFLKNG